MVSVAGASYEPILQFWLANTLLCGGFRRYVHEQAFLALPPLLLRAVQQLIPSVRLNILNLVKK